MTDSSTPTAATRVPRIRDRRQASGLMKASMVLFFVGLLAITADLVLFASGMTELPLWLNLLCLLAPVGFGLGLFAVVQENRRRAPRSGA